MPLGACESRRDLRGGLIHIEFVTHSYRPRKYATLTLTLRARDSRRDFGGELIHALSS